MSKKKIIIYLQELVLDITMDVVLCYQFCIIISYIKIFRYLKYIIPIQYWITFITKESIIKRVYMSYINNKLWISGNTIIESDKIKKKSVLNWFGN